MVNESEIYVKYVPQKYGIKSTIAQVCILFEKNVFLHKINDLFIIHSY
jgi:hypothetical protein